MCEPSDVTCYVAPYEASQLDSSGTIQVGKGVPYYFIETPTTCSRASCVYTFRAKAASTLTSLKGTRD